MSAIRHDSPVKSRVLVADDHLAVLESVCRFLADAYDVVARASDGRQALELARQFQPDVAVIDVRMPVLNGFETLERLKRELPELRVIFLTMHDDDQFVAAAINAGAHGYVLKSRLHLDLMSAIEHSLEGRLFVPSLSSLKTVSGSHHTVMFHTDDDRFLDDVSQLIASTLQAVEPVVVVTAESTRTGIADRLRGRRMDLPALVTRGLYFERDSAVALSEVMRGGTLDKARSAEIIAGFEQFRIAAPNGPRSRLTIIADLTVSLWRRGDVAAALALERTWNELVHGLPFLTVCVIPIDCFAGSEAGAHLQAVRAEHGIIAGPSQEGHDTDRGRP
jgi:DNA-binding NarL/FixJ family response regulator